MNRLKKKPYTHINIGWDLVVGYYNISGLMAQYGIPGYPINNRQGGVRGNINLLLNATT
jgi:hypothetical protein